MASMAQMPEISIVGHFDLPTKFDERTRLYNTASPAYREAAFAAMETLHAAGKIFEINAGAIGSGWRSTPYPSEELLRHLHAIGGRVCISSDAHSAKNLLFGFEMCEELARACGFREVWHFSGSGFEPEKLA
jgi:histidinol-phosphatase (PHP family)